VGSDDLPGAAWARYNDAIAPVAAMDAPARPQFGPVLERESFGAQAPIALITLAVIAAIALINANGRAPTPPTQVVTLACATCGTVVSVRRSAHSMPVYYVEIQMLDGSTRVVQQLAAGFKVGDIVQVNGNALTLRSISS
jgi:hypothetical protein